MICYVRTNKRGYGGSAPMKKKRCHPEGTSADVWCPKDLVARPFTSAPRCRYEVVCSASAGAQSLRTQASLKSSYFGLTARMRSRFFCRVIPLRDFSLAIALFIS